MFQRGKRKIGSNINGIRDQILSQTGNIKPQEIITQYA